MKLKLITLTAISALSLGGAAFAQGQDRDAQERHGGHGGRRHDSLEKITETLNLTPEQKTKIQPILDQAKPQIEAIRREAMQKTKAVMDNARTQIRPLLTPEQQKQIDESQNDRRGGHEGRRGRHGQGGQDEQDNQ
jgi:Spy/CpxP family protein refolding chaperone